jgi:hypothetical protein
MDLPDHVKLDVVWKNYNRRTSTSTQKYYFEEREAPPSLVPVAHHLQLYTQSELITTDVPTDILNLTAADVDDTGQPLGGSYFGRTSSVSAVVRKYVQVPLVPIPTPNGKAFQAPRCIQLTSATAFSVGEILAGATSGARAKVVSVSGAYVFYAAAWSGSADFRQGEPVSGSVTALTAAVALNSASCQLSRVLSNAIPFDFGNGGYNYQLFSSSGTQVKFGEGNWLVNAFSGVVTFYGTLPNGVSAVAPPCISFYRYVGNIGLNFANGPGGTVGIMTQAPAVSLDIRASDAIRIPVGSTAQRPLPPEPGYVRFNTTLQAYEGYNGLLWDDLSKGTGASSDDVSVGTGGSDRAITIGNQSGNTSIDLLSGTGNIALRNNNAVVVDAASSISMSTRGPGASSLNFGSGVDDLAINFYATGSNSCINFFGPTNMAKSASTPTSVITGSLSLESDGVWQIALRPDASGTTTQLVFQRCENGTFVTRHAIG